MLRALLIGGFGFIGTLSRYYLQGFTQRLTHGTFPYGTLAVNVLGSLVVGFVAALTLERVAMNPAWRSAILIGFCGVARARESGLAGATVLRGLMGIGAKSRIHTAKVLRLSEDLPIVVEIADRRDRIEAFLPSLDEMVADGLVTLERVQVITYRPGKEAPKS